MQRAVEFSAAFVFMRVSPGERVTKGNVVISYLLPKNLPLLGDMNPTTSLNERG
jgi:hypothetical protein